MAAEHDEDALLDRLAKGLEAVRQDAELARSGGAEGLSAGLARAEVEARSTAAGLEALRQRFEEQQAVTARLEASATKNESDLHGLRQTVEALSLRVREQAEPLAKSSARRPAGVAVFVVIVVALLALAGGSAAWLTSGRLPAGARFSELTGINLPGRDEPPRPAQTVAQATPSPEPTAQPEAATAPQPAVSAAPAPATPPAATAQAPSAAPSAPAETAAAVLPAPAEPPAAAAPPPAQTPAAPAPPTPQTAAATPPGPVTPAPAAAPPMSQSATPGPAAPALAPAPGPPQAVRQLVLRATANSWVRVRRKGGRVLLRRVMKDGETWPVPAESDLLLDSRNAGALELEVNGVPTKLPGAKRGVVHAIPLDVDLR